MKKILFLVLTLLVAFNCNNITPIINPGDGCPACKILLTVNKLIYTTSDTIAVTLHNNSDVPVYLEGCNPIYYATLTDTGWVAKPIRECFWEGFEIKVEPGTAHVEEYPAVNWIGIHKFIAGVSFECEDGKPLSQAHCAKNDKVESLQFTVLEK
jgi:hypothetical protein